MNSVGDSVNHLWFRILDENLFKDTYAPTDEQHKKNLAKIGSASHESLPVLMEMFCRSKSLQKSITMDHTRFSRIGHLSFRETFKRGKVEKLFPGSPPTEAESFFLQHEQDLSSANDRLQRRVVANRQIILALSMKIKALEREESIQNKRKIDIDDLHSNDNATMKAKTAKEE